MASEGAKKSVGKEKTKNSLPKKVPVFVLMSPKNLTAEMSEFVKRKALLSTENFFRSRPGPLTTNGLRVGDVALCCACGKAILLTRC